MIILIGISLVFWGVIGVLALAVFFNVLTPVQAAELISLAALLLLQVGSILSE
jgi:hypothetical protein